MHDNSLRRTYGEVCVSDDEGGDCGSSVCDADEDDVNCSLDLPHSTAQDDRLYQPLCCAKTLSSLMTLCMIGTTEVYT